MGKYFGTDGFRGEANKNLDYEHAVKIGRFLGFFTVANLLALTVLLLFAMVAG